MWFAISTVTTVGYGDVTPKTDGGRAIAIVIMLVGIGFIAMLTAAMAQLFLRTIVEKDTRVTLIAESEVLARLDQLGAQIALLSDAVRSQERRTSAVEDAISSPDTG